MVIGLPQIRGAGDMSPFTARALALEAALSSPRAGSAAAAPPFRSVADSAAGAPGKRPHLFSTPFAIEKKVKRYGCYIDVNGIPHEASWTGNWAIFEFTDTSQIADFQLSPLPFPNELSTAWKSSIPLAFGGHASVRARETGRYPVVKIAHPTNKCRRLVEREFNIMRTLSTLDAVAQIADKPLRDQDGVFGFHLERLFRVELDELQRRFREVERLLDALHNAGYCHGDCSFSNIMQNQEGRLVLIDLAFAGRLGTDIPEVFPKHLSQGSSYTVNIDRKMIQKWGIPRP